MSKKDKKTSELNDKELLTSYQDTMKKLQELQSEAEKRHRDKKKQEELEKTQQDIMKSYEKPKQRQKDIPDEEKVSKNVSKDLKQKNKERMVASQGYSGKQVLFFVGLTGFIMLSFFLTYEYGKDTGFSNGYINAMNTVSLETDVLRDGKMVDCLTFSKYSNDEVCFEVVKEPCDGGPNC